MQCFQCEIFRGIIYTFHRIPILGCRHLRIYAGHTKGGNKEQQAPRGQGQHAVQTARRCDAGFALSACLACGASENESYQALILLDALVIYPFPPLSKVILAAVTIAVYGWRLTLNKGDDAKMDEKTNPANHIDGWFWRNIFLRCSAKNCSSCALSATDFVLRVLTKNYYAFLHFWLLVCPMVLCCDWSSFGVPNITGWEDPRNLSTASLYASLVCAILAHGLLFCQCVSRWVTCAPTFAYNSFVSCHCPAYSGSLFGL